MASVTLSKSYPTEVEAQKAADEYCRSYHPAGYGTTYKITPNPDGTFQLRTHRFDSCD